MICDVIDCLVAPDIIECRIMNGSIGGIVQERHCDRLQGYARVGILIITITDVDRTKYCISVDIFTQELFRLLTDA